MSVGLRLDADWLKPPSDGPLPEVDLTWARLLIEIAGRPVTKYRTDKGEGGDRLPTTAYYLAEWLAENWWAVLHEPEKADSSDRGHERARNDEPSLRDDYLYRHWMGIARNGFALPDVWLVPAGDQMSVSAIASRMSTSRLEFKESSETYVPLSDARQALFDFVSAVVSRLEAGGIRDSDLQENWRLIKNTATDSQRYCELIGALGLSPYDDHPEIDAVLDAAADVLEPQMLRELCEASSAEKFGQLANFVRHAFVAAGNSPEFDLSPLGHRKSMPGEAPWRWGKRLAGDLRAKLGVPPIDREGGSRIMKTLGVDYESASSLSTRDEDREIEGAVRRSREAARFALVRKRDEPSRRFAAMRATFLAWGAPEDGAALVTDARTRDQQASRAFAAEILAPIDYIKQAAGRAPMSGYRINDIAAELRVSPKVVWNQAKDNGLQLATY